MNRCQQRTKICHIKWKYTGLSECSTNQWLISDHWRDQQSNALSILWLVCWQHNLFSSICNADILTPCEPQSSFLESHSGALLVQNPNLPDYHWETEYTLSSNSLDFNPQRQRGDLCTRAECHPDSSRRSGLDWSTKTNLLQPSVFSLQTEHPWPGKPSPASPVDGKQLCVWMLRRRNPLSHTSLTVHPPRSSSL